MKWICPVYNNLAKTSELNIKPYGAAEDLEMEGGLDQIR